MFLEEHFQETLYSSKYIHQFLAKTSPLPHNFVCTFVIAKSLLLQFSRATSTSTLPAISLVCDLPSSQLLRLVQVLALILTDMVVSCQQTYQNSKKSQCVHPALVHCPFGSKSNITLATEMCYSWGTGGRNTAKFLWPVPEIGGSEKTIFEFFKIFVAPICSSVFQRSIKPTFQRRGRSGR